MHALLSAIELNFFNWYGNNYDAEMLEHRRTSISQRMVSFAGCLLSRLHLVRKSDLRTFFAGVEPYVWFSERFDMLYQALADQRSRDLLIKISAFRVLGNRKIMLPLNTRQFWNQREELRKLADRDDTLVSGAYTLRLVDLSVHGYPLRFYGSPGGLQCLFFLKQYEYSSETIQIKVAQGDVVIDAGGCWGDTALYFAHGAGVDGKVLTVEFVPSNLEVMQRNFQLNEDLRRRIEVVEHPLWSKSAVPLRFTDRGPSSRGSLDMTSSNTGGRTYLSTPIDEIVEHYHLSKVNLIKMDIESAEVEALRGAVKTISRFRPKLAISVYHSISDFVSVFELVSSLKLGYRFYLGHSTIHWHETILFGICELPSSTQ
jgi:FkbM family methyltransferase